MYNCFYDVELRKRLEISDLNDKFNKSIHPLQAVILRQNAERLAINLDNFPSDSPKEFFGCLVRKDNLGNKIKLVVSVRIVEDSDFGDEDTDIPLLHVSSIFLERYDFRNEERVVFKRTACLPLEKVVLGARTHDSFTWLSGSDWTTKLLVTVCQQKAFCRIGDTIVMSPEFFSENDTFKPNMMMDVVVLECHPVGEGILTLNTVLVVTKISNVSDEVRSHEVGQNSKFIEKFPINSNALSYLHLMNYTSKLILPISRHLSTVPFNPVFRSYAATSTLLKSVWNKFKVEIMPKPLSYDERMNNNKYGFSERVDSLNQIFLSRKDLTSIGIENGSWVKIKLLSAVKRRKCRSISYDFSNNTVGKTSESEDRNASFPLRGTEIRNKFRVALISYDYSLDRKQLSQPPHGHSSCVSPLLWFNLNQHPSDFLQPESYLLIEDVSTQLSNKINIPYAKEVYLSLIQSPHYNATINSDALLHEYFSIPRYVCLRDVFCVSTRNDPTFHQKLDDPVYVRWPVIYFCVSVIDGPPSSFGYLVDKEHCRLYQSGTVQSYIPVTMETYVSPDSFHPVWDAAQTPGLKHYVEELTHLIRPFLKSHSSRRQVSSNILLTGGVCCGKTTIVKAVCRCLNLHLYQVNCNELAGDSVGSTEARLNNSLLKASMYAPCILLLRNIHLIGKEAVGEDPRVINTFSEALRNLNSDSGEWPVITIATNLHEKQLNSELLSTFLHQITIKPLDEEDRADVLRELLSPYMLGNNVSIVYLAQRTAGFELGDLSLLVSEAVKTTYARMKKTVAKYHLTFEEEEEISQGGVLVLQEDLLNALEKLQSAHAQSIGAPKVPNVHWEDIGGLSDVKQEILDTIQLPLQQPELLATGLRRSGVLLYGPPGTGKTLLAKAVATECSLNFLSVKGPELINMYVGQSEENVREVFHRARSAVPCIIFFDELDSLAPNRGRSGDSGGVMDRVVSQLLAELDGLNKSAEVFVIGATNRPDLIDPALLRPGRFDRLLYVGVPEDKDSRMKIMKALTKKFLLDTDVNLEDIVDKCPPGVTGADIYSLCSYALKRSMGRNIQLIEQGVLKIEESKLVVTTEDFEAGVKSLIPSVSIEELLKFKQIKSSFSV